MNERIGHIEVSPIAAGDCPDMQKTAKACPECMDRNSVDVRLCSLCGEFWSVAAMVAEIRQLRERVEHQIKGHQEEIAEQQKMHEAEMVGFLENFGNHQRMMDVARRYYILLDKVDGADSEKLKMLGEELDHLSAPFSENPAYMAYLERKREVAFHKKSRVAK